MRNLAKLQKGEHILGLTNISFEKDRICSACQAKKQVGAKHPIKNVVTTKRPLELLHMDIFGPITYISIGGNKYGFVIVDDYSRFTWVFFLREKSKVQGIFKKFARRAQNEFDARSRVEMTIGQSSRIPTLKSSLMKKESSMSFWFHILHNKMVLWRGRTKLS